MKTVSLRLHDELLARLEREAGLRGITKSALGREILERGLDRYSSAGPISCYDLAHDLAGSIDGLPKDLADDSKYMASFGS